MKTIGAPKSKFVYPEKLYARCKDNKTLDISYAPQNMEAVEYTRTDAFIEKACNVYCKVCKMPNCRSNECKWISNFKEHLETI